ncbi:MAG: DJ-1/PfpI family protein [Oscillospiraceae bacterium]|nr:DJ-1/PfpI family protein [Oscillospiraceae bacterium]
MNVCVLLAPGFEETEAIVPIDLLRRGGVTVTLAGVYGLQVEGSHGITVQADCRLSAVALDEVDMVFLPGGLKGVDNLLASESACQFLREAKGADKWLAAICAAPTVLSRLGLIDGAEAVCYPGMEDLLAPAIPRPGHRVVRGGHGEHGEKLLTGEAAGSAFDLGLSMLAALTDDATADRVREAVHYHG